MALTFLVVLLGVATQPASAASASAASASVVSGQAFPAKTYVLDVQTGKVLREVSGTLSPAISNTNFCYSGYACYYSGQVPYANQGFWGSPGTFNGSWPYRSGGFTGVYNAKFCWNSGVCGPILNPNTTFSFGGGVRVTGISVTIY